MAAVVCRHLLGREGGPAGFLENSDDPDDLQVWCHACEALYQEEGEMTKALRKFDDMAIVCVECYAAATPRQSVEARDA